MKRWGRGVALPLVVCVLWGSIDASTVPVAAAPAECNPDSSAVEPLPADDPWSVNFDPGEVAGTESEPANASENGDVMPSLADVSSVAPSSTDVGPPSLAGESPGTTAVPDSVPATSVGTDAETTTTATDPTATSTDEPTKATDCAPTAASLGAPPTYPEFPPLPPVATAEDLAKVSSEGVVTVPVSAPVEQDVPYERRASAAPPDKDAEFDLSVGEIRTAASVAVSLSKGAPLTHVRVLPSFGTDAKRPYFGMGVLLTNAVDLAGGRAGGSLSLHYASFESGLGGDWASRLRVYAVPTCVLADSVVAGCDDAWIEVPSSNDLKAGVISADISLGGGRGGGFGERRALASTSSAFVISSGAAGSAGNFAAAPLSPSSTWSSGGSSGNFSWSYPVPVPPSTAGPTPTVELSYSSQAIDGMTSEANNQGSVVGAGWAMTEAYVQRRYKACGDDGTPAKPYDLCWSPLGDTSFVHDILVLNGRESDLIPVAFYGDGTPSEFRLSHDDGSRVQRFVGGTGSAGNPIGNPTIDSSGEYFVLTTVDGTRYSFGLGRENATGSPTYYTNSVWTVPVRGNNPGEPCYGSICHHGWRWNLDRVEDTNGNVQSNVYNVETNRYGAGSTQYARGGFLVAIGYSKRTGLESQQPATRIDFTYQLRCKDLSASCAAPNPSAPAEYPDVPVDLICTGTCSSTTPATFFTTYRLTQITTAVLTPSGYRTVDQITLTHEFPATGEVGVGPKLWLRAIQRQGLAFPSGPITLPAVRFDSYQSPMLPNRADGNPAAGVPHMYFFRVDTITNEIGGQTKVVYGQPDPCSPIPYGAWNTNTKDCFPAWSSIGTGGFVAFNKYLALSVTLHDTVGGSPDAVTAYQYLYGGGWRHPEDQLIPNARESWSEWRGYAVVITRVGSATKNTTLDVFYRGLDDAYMGSGAPRSDVWITTSDGSTSEDKDFLAGSIRESRQLNTDLSAELHKELTSYWSQATGTFGSKSSFMVRQSAVVGTTLQSAFGTKQSETDTLYTSHGVAYKIIDKPDLAVPAEWRCALSVIIENTTAWILDKPFSIDHYKSADAAHPSNCTDAAQVTSSSQFSYDLHALGAAPTAGNMTSMTARIDASTSSTTTFGFDSLGRQTSVTDNAGHTSMTTYSAPSVYPPTITLTNALSQSLIERIDPAFGVVTATTDPNGHYTQYWYDSLGRPWQLWKDYAIPNLAGAPDLIYDYTIDPAKISPPKVKTRRLSDVVNYSAVWMQSVVYADGFGRTRETQATADGTNQRTIAFTKYDDRGLLSAESAPIGATGTVDSGFVNPSYAVSNEHRYTYDDYGRLYQSLSYVNNVFTWDGALSHVYDGWVDYTVVGNWIDVTGQITDERGRVLYTYGGSGDTQWTAYTYDDHDRVVSRSDPNSNTTYYAYDQLGRKTDETSPESGNTHTTYNTAGMVASVTDATLASTWFEYDPVNRLTRKRTGSASGAITAENTWDSTSIGQLATTSTCLGASPTACATPYTVSYQYDFQDRISTKTYTIPATEPGLAGSYQFNYGYDLAGRLSATYLPQINDTGITPYSETDVNVYKNETGHISQTWVNGVPGGNHPIVSSTLYNNRGQLLQLRDGNYAGYNGGNDLLNDYTYDSLDRLTGITMRVTSASSTTYFQIDTMDYDGRSNVTRVVNGLTASQQCFEYDNHSRLTKAYTMASNPPCSAPSVPQGNTVPYSTTWAYNQNNTFQSSSRQAANGTWTTYNYTYLPGRGTTVNTFGTYIYQPDAAGRLIHRDQNGVQTYLRWDTTLNQPCYRDSTTNANPCNNPPVNSSSYVYMPDGQRLIRRENTGTANVTTVLTMENMEVIYTPASSTPITHNTYYSAAGRLIAQNLYTGLTIWFATDYQNSVARAVVNTLAPYAPLNTQLWYPYGALRGYDPNPYTRRGYIGQNEDPSGYLYLNHRYYDPNLGQFLSVDPVVATTGQPYLYAQGNPVTRSDPSGLDPDTDARIRARARSYVSTVVPGSRQCETCGPAWPTRPAPPAVGPGQVILQAPDNVSPGDLISVVGDGLTGVEVGSQICASISEGSLCGKVFKVTSSAGNVVGGVGALVTCNTGTRADCGTSVVWFLADVFIDSAGGGIAVVATHLVYEWGGNFVAGGLEALRSNQEIWPNSMPGTTPNASPGVGLGNEGGFTVVPSYDGQMEDAIRSYCAAGGDWTTCGG